MINSKTLELVEIQELVIPCKIASPLIEAMNNSCVKKLKIGYMISKAVVSGLHCPEDRVELIYITSTGDDSNVR